MEKSTVNADFIEYLLVNNAQTLVGKSMRRFETISDKYELKQAIKDLIYEQSRDLKQSLFIYFYGVKLTQEAQTKS